MAGSRGSTPTTPGPRWSPRSVRPRASTTSSTSRCAAASSGRCWPGRSGRDGVAVDGPYNEHLVRDFGGLNLALAVVTIAALVLGTRAFVRTAAIAWLAWSVPHLVYHVRHLDVFATGDKVANVFALSLLV